MAISLEWFAHAVFKYGGSLFMEPNGKEGRYVMSLERVALCAVLAQSMWIWHYENRDIVPTMEHVLYALMATAFGNKGLQALKEFKGARDALQATAVQAALAQPPSTGAP